MRNLTDTTWNRISTDGHNLKVLCCSFPQNLCLSEHFKENDKNEITFRTVFSPPPPDSDSTTSSGPSKTKVKLIGSYDAGWQARGNMKSYNS